jgi:CRP-like cAMP-binding protein
VGYGDVTAHTDIEMIWSFVVMLFGAIIFAMITGKIASRMMTQKGTIQKYNTEMDDVRQYLINKKVSTSIRRHVIAYYEALYDGKHVYDEQSILVPLPSAVSIPVVAEIYQKSMHSVALFRKLDQQDDGAEVMLQICLRLQHEVALPTDHVIFEGRVGNTMYLIEAGEVDVYKNVTVRDGKPQDSEEAYKNKLRLGRLGPRCFFGELAVMSNAHNSQVRVRTVVARTTCHLNVLSKETLDQLRMDYASLDRELWLIESPIRTPFDSHLRAQSTSPRRRRASISREAHTPEELQLWFAEKLIRINDRIDSVSARRTH